MNNQVLLTLNDKDFIWDLEKSPILTVTELDGFEIKIPSVLGQDVDFLLEDYHVKLICFEDYLCSTKLQIFRESFGVAIGRLCIDGSIFEICFDVLAKKISTKKIENMLSFLYKNNQEIMNICFSRTMAKKTVGDVGDSDPEILIKQAEIFVNKFMDLRQDFFFNLKKRLVPQKTPIWISGGSNDFFEIDDFFENIDKISPAISEGDVLLNGRYFSIDRTYKTDLVETSATYENSIILGGAQSILDKIKKVNAFLRLNFSSPTLSYDKEYENLCNFIARVTFSALEKRCLLLIEHLEEIVRYLKHDLKIPYKGEIFPRVTPYVRGVKVYRILFDQLAVWYKLGMPNFEGLILLSKIRSISKIYELFCLYKIYETFYKMDWVVISASRNEELGGGIPKTVLFQKQDDYIEVRYEDKVQPISQDTRHLDLVDLDHYRNWKYAFYNPDFVLMHKNKSDVNYFIFDAKYSNRDNVIKNHLPSVYNKYYQGLGVVDFYKKIVSSDRILSVSVLYPDSSSLTEKYKVNNLKGHSLIRLPFSDAVSMRDEDDSTFKDIVSKLLDVSSQYMK